MTQDKLKKLVVYASNLKDRLSSPVPEKHKDHPASFKLFLTRELETVTKQLEEAKLDGVVGKK